MITEQSRADFEYQAGEALGLSVSIIEMARKGDGYDHAYDSMNIMQPLNGWWYWWKKSRAALVLELPHKCGHLNTHNGHVIPEAASYDEAIDDCADAIRAAGITVKEG